VKMEKKKKLYIFFFKGMCTTTVKAVGDNRACFDNTLILVMP